MWTTRERPTFEPESAQVSAKTRHLFGQITLHGQLARRDVCIAVDYQQGDPATCGRAAEAVFSSSLHQRRDSAAANEQREGNIRAISCG